MVKPQAGRDVITLLFIISILILKKHWQTASYILQFQELE